MPVCRFRLRPHQQVSPLERVDQNAAIGRSVVRGLLPHPEDDADDRTEVAPDIAAKRIDPVKSSSGIVINVVGWPDAGKRDDDSHGTR